MKKITRLLCILGLGVFLPFLLTGCDKSGENGLDGKQVEFQKSDTHIQWRYEGETNWNDLIELDEIKGQDFVTENCTLSYDINFPKEISNETLIQEIPNSMVAKGDGYVVPSPQFSNPNLATLFKGWAIKGYPDIMVNPYMAVVSDVELIGVWDTELITEQLSICEKFTVDRDDYTEFDARIKNCNDTTSTSLTFPSYYILNKKLYKITTIQSDTTINNSTCVNVVIPNTITRISLFFSGFSALKNISLPNTLTYLAGFRGNTSIETITIPENVETIESYTFEGCSNLQSVYIKSHKEIINCKKIVIGECAFKNCLNLEVFTETPYIAQTNTIPARVKTINAEAFMSCEKLNNVVFSFASSITANSINYAYYCNYIGPRAFYGCSSIESIMFNQTVTNSNIDLITDEYRINISDEAFKNCSSLSSFTEKGFVNKIGSHCFENCTTLNSFNSYWNNIDIDMLAFKGCSSLTNLTIGKEYSSNKIDNMQSSLDLGNIINGSSINWIFINTDAFFGDFRCNSLNGETFTLTKISIDSNVTLSGEFETYITDNFTYDSSGYYLINE